MEFSTAMVGDKWAISPGKTYGTLQNNRKGFILKTKPRSSRPLKQVLLMFHWKCENTEVSELVVVVFCLTSVLFVPLDLLFSIRFPDQKEKERYQTKVSQNVKCETCSQESTLIAS